jgi:hypothetical protein
MNILNFLLKILNEMKAKASERITVVVNHELSKQLNNALASIRKIRSNPKITKSELIREILECYTTKQEPIPNEDAYEIIIGESIEYEKGGTEAANQGSSERAQKMFLLAAAREIEALAVIDKPNENIIKSALIRIVMLLKSGTNYLHLPDIPAHQQKISSSRIMS